MYWRCSTQKCIWPWPFLSNGQIHFWVEHLQYIDLEFYFTIDISCSIFCFQHQYHIFLSSRDKQTKYFWANNSIFTEQPSSFQFWTNITYFWEKKINLPKQFSQSNQSRFGFGLISPIFEWKIQLAWTIFTEQPKSFWFWTNITCFLVA